MDRLASIIISSYNYARYLPACIDSALAQTHPRVEVIVVDDGSTDESLRIVRGYGRRVLPVPKENAGQASCINAGFRASQGDVILFVDSDDLLAPTAVATAAHLLQQDVVKAHWPLRLIDGAGNHLGLHPLEPSAGDLRERAISGCPTTYSWPPTTGNAWRRSFLERVLPMPEAEYRVQPDQYLCTLALLYGPIAAHRTPLGCWRVHGTNASYHHAAEERLSREYDRAEFTLQVAARHCAALGLRSNVDAWRTHSYHHQVYHAVQDLVGVLPARRPFALIHDGRLGDDLVLHGRPVVPFLERDGQYWGRPGDDRTAMAELSKLRAMGIRHFVVVWPNFWWLDHYRGLHRELRALPCVLENDRIIVFQLQG
jgi:glycosyltransferase involved in cell wall biosynthesis